MDSDIIGKIKASGLTGRGGACFPTGQKWEMVATSPEKERYIVCNASEGDPHTFKDKYLLENNLSEIINGIVIAIETIKPKKTYIYLAPHFKDLKANIEKEIQGKPITIFDKPDDLYPHGEETVALNAIEGQKLEPRTRPPYPTEMGLWGKPTLINNVETFYWISQIAKGKYSGEIFVCIYKDGQKPIIAKAKPTDMISQVLVENNISGDPDTQVGGIAGKKGKLSEVDQTLEKLFCSIYIINR